MKGVIMTRWEKYTDQIGTFLGISCGAFGEILIKYYCCTDKGAHKVGDTMAVATQPEYILVDIPEIPKELVDKAEKIINTKKQKEITEKKRKIQELQKEIDELGVACYAVYEINCIRSKQ